MFLPILRKMSILEDVIASTKNIPPQKIITHLLRNKVILGRGEIILRVSGFPFILEVKHTN